MSDKVTTTIKTMGFCGPCSASEPAEVDVYDDRILRIRPFSYVQHAGEEGLKTWTIKARGKEFSSAEKSEITPFALATKHRVYSPNRILYPMKRVDWDPRGERNPQNRGKSKYVRISWDEATQLIADEVMRVKKTYGTNSIFVQSDGHHQVKTLHGPRGCQVRCLTYLAATVCRRVILTPGRAGIGAPNTCGGVILLVKLTAIMPSTILLRIATRSCSGGVM